MVLGSEGKGGDGDCIYDGRFGDIWGLGFMRIRTDIAL